MGNSSIVKYDAVSTTESATENNTIKDITKESQQEGKDAIVWSWWTKWSHANYDRPPAWKVIGTITQSTTIYRQGCCCTCATTIQHNKFRDDLHHAIQELCRSLELSVLRRGGNCAVEPHIALTRRHRQTHCITWLEHWTLMVECTALSLPLTGDPALGIPQIVLPPRSSSLDSVVLELMRFLRV